MGSTIQDIARAKKEEIRTLKARQSTLEQRAREADPVRPFVNALREKKTGLIAEIKKASPSQGLIRKDFDPPTLARAFEAGGAACLSVLTDQRFFQGQKTYLYAARQACSLPVLRKDFLYDPCQVAESRALGADCILIIMAAVSQDQAKELFLAACSWNMDTLLEVHTPQELERALQIGGRLIGINNRNLNTFEVNLKVSLELSSQIPKHCLAVAESGIQGPHHIARLKEVGIHCFLVGESLMAHKDVEKATRALID